MNVNLFSSRSLYLLRISHEKKVCKFLKRKRDRGKAAKKKKKILWRSFYEWWREKRRKKLINIRFLLLPFLYHLITWNSWCSKNKIEMHFSFVLELIHIWAIFIPKKMLFHSQENTRCFQSTSNSRIFVRIFRLILIIWQMKMQKIIDNLF